MTKFRLLLLVVLIAALLFRITFPDIIEFKGDEALSILLAARPIFGHSFSPGATVSSVAIMNPPLINYILFPFIIFTRNPQVISILIGLLNSVAVTFFFITVKKYYNLKTALFSSLLLALSPWAIIYSRKIWIPDFIIPLFMLIFYNVHKILIEKKNIFWIPLIVCCFFLVQIHLITIFFVLILASLLMYKGKPKLKYIFIGFLIGLLPLIPYLLFELKNGCPDCIFFLNAKNRLSSTHSLLLFLRPLDITGVGDFKFILGEDLTLLKQKYFFASYITTLLLTHYLLLPLGIFVFYKKYKNLRVWVYVTLSLPLIYFMSKIEPLMHYFLIILPLLFLFIGTLFNLLTNSNNKWVKFSSYLLFTLIIFSYLNFNFYFFRFLETKKTVSGDFGSIYSISKSDVEKNLINYKGDLHYEEMFLTSFVPQFIFQGDLPMANIFFDREKTQNNLDKLESRLKLIPDDYRIQNELIFYYSHTTPTIKEIKLLREKSRLIPGYSNVYNELYYGAYLNRGHKKEYQSKIYNISLAYPEHWMIEEADNILSISGDGVVIQISKNPIGEKVLKLNGNSLFLNSSKSNSIVEEIVESIREY